MKYTFAKGDQVIFDDTVYATVVDFAGFTDGVPYYALSPMQFFPDPVPETKLKLHETLAVSKSTWYDKTCTCGVDSVGQGRHSMWCNKSGTEYGT